MTFVAHSKFLSSEDALRVFEPYDIVLDCTDHPTSRYLISDTCVLLGKPLVSASALKTEGQLMVLNNPPAEQGSSSGGPCYRCVFPKPPPADSVVSCGEGGILGPVVGAMGILQALEAIKVICAPKPSRVASGEPPPSPTLLMFSAYSNPQFRSVRLRGRRSDCTACGTTPAITTESLTSGSLDYMAFCGVTNPVNILQEDERMTGPDLASKIKAPNSRMQQETDPPATIIDVRDPTHFSICHLPGSINVPLSKLRRDLDSSKRSNTVPDWWTGRRKTTSGDLPPAGVEDTHSLAQPTLVALNKTTHKENENEDSRRGQTQQRQKQLVVFVCNLGNDSQVAARMVADAGLGTTGPDRADNGDSGAREADEANVGEQDDRNGAAAAAADMVRLFDLKGGFKAWREEVDGTWPDY